MGQPGRDDVALLPQDAPAFGEEIRSILRTRGLTVRAAAGLIASSASEISRWQCGRKVPDRWQFEIMGERLGIPAAEMRRLEALRRAAEQERIAPGRPPAGAEQTEAPRSELPGRPRLRPVWWWSAAAIVCVAVAIGWLTLRDRPDSPAGPPAAASGADADTDDAADASDTPVVPVRGEPAYVQCSDRDRSMLSAPGKARGGTHRGYIRPGQQFVVTGETQWWKRGYLKDDPAKQIVFVMSRYLSATNRRC